MDREQIEKFIENNGYIEASSIIDKLKELIFKTDKDMQMQDPITLYPLVIKRLNNIIKELEVNPS